MNLEELVLPMKSEDNAFRASLSRVIQLAEGAIQAVEGLIKTGFEWADQLDSIQDVMGVTNEAAAALNFTLRKSKTDTGALTKGMVILEKGLVKADGTLDASGKKLKDWGINVFDANGKLKDQTQLIGEISDKYASFSTQQEKVNFLTDTFGKSGAELVDFFDTLASEGGIDAVTKKVEAFGLAIDPNRYEQFNRNLAELKLIGTGLAVQFTEKVMPVLEKFLGWFTEFAMDPDPEKALTKIDAFVSGIINGLATRINTWVQGGGPEELSNQIISFIDGIGAEGSGVESKSLEAAQRLLTALANAIGEIDWAAIAEAIDTNLADAINSHDWAANGEAFGDMIASLLATDVPTAMQNKKSDAATAIGNAIVEWFTAAAGPENVAAFNNLETSITQQIRTTLLGAFGKGTAGLGEKQIFFNIGMSMANALTGGLAGNIGNFIGALVTFEARTMSKLTDISKTFFNAGGKWINQAVAGFNDHKNALISAISTIVGEVNAVLRKIITSFAISIKLPSWLTGIPSTTPGTVGGGIKPPKNKRASGGPVIAGQTYEVAEFFRPEKFSPTSNGRIDALRGNQEVNLSMNSIRNLAEELSKVMPSVMTKALASV